MARGAALPYETHYPEAGLHQAVPELLTLSQPVGAPLVVWGEQIADGRWRDVTPRRIDLVRVSDRVLAEVQARTGVLPDNGGVLHRAPALLSDLESAFEGSAYELFGSFGVSDARDCRSDPPIVFLTLGALGDLADHVRAQQIGRRPTTLEQLARQLGGLPVVAVTERPTNWLPREPFQSAVLRLTAGRATMGS